MERLDDKLFGAMVEHLTDVIVVLTPDAVVRFVSPTIHLKLGYQPEQLVGRSGFEILHPDDRARVTDALRFSLDNAAIPVTVQMRLARRKGGYRTFRAIAKNMVKDPVVQGVVVTLNDITDRLAKEAEIRAASQARDAMNALLRLTLEDHPLDELLRSALGVVVSAGFDFLDGRGVLFVGDRETREMRLAAQIGMPSGFNAVCGSVPFGLRGCEVGARAGGEPGAGGAPAERDCPGLCPTDRLIVPLMAGREPLGALVVGVRGEREKSAAARDLLVSLSEVLSEMIRRHLVEEENERLSAIVRENPHPVMEFGRGGDLTYHNAAVKKIAWQYGVEIPDLLPETHREIVAQLLAEGAEAARTAESEVSGRIFGWTYQAADALDRVHVFGRDITERLRAEEQLLHGAMYDPLTGLPNRSLLKDRILAALDRARRLEDRGVAVLMLNVDRFKLITESLGHAAGDGVLVEVGRRLSASAGAGNTVGRLGGDEFVVLLADVRGPDEAVRIARGIIDRLAEPFPVEGLRLELAASVGIALSKPEHAGADEILRDADTAMHRAKSLGGGRHAVFDEDMHRDAVERLRAQTELRGGIERGEMIVHYQPVFTLKDLRIRGFEALVRWNHPTQGMIPPGKFIPVAEQTGLIVPLGEQVLRQVCTQLSAWRRARLPLAWVSVNIAAQQFQQDDIVPQIVSCVGEAGIDGKRLFLEITEGTAAQDPERAMRTMAALKQHGMRIALDDFGTGYSSMAYLKRFPIDTLKIDRSFVRDLPESQDDAAIASSVIAMSHALGLKVVAEGVESERQALFLRSLECDEVQGFLYGKPTTAESATALLQQGWTRA